MPPQPSLLGLPTEVRSLILQEVPLISRPAPCGPTRLRDQECRVIVEAQTGAWEENGRVVRFSKKRKALQYRVRFEESPVPNPALSLLLTNRQLHDETQDMLKRQYSEQPADYTLDIVYLKDCTLWPTWLSVPVRASHVDSLTAQFRLFNCPDDMRMTSEPLRGMFHIGCGGPEAIMWPFYHLLMITSKFGPCRQPITMRRLVVDFLPTEEDGILPLGLVTFQRSKNKDAKPTDYYERWLPENWAPPQGASLTAPAMMMNFIKTQLENLLRLSDSHFPYGKILYETVGEIEIRLEGRVYANIDCADMLASVIPWGGGPGSSSLERWKSQFCVWKPQVEARRRKLGMPVKDEA